MGFLKCTDAAYKFKDGKKYHTAIQNYGILQAINVWNKHKDRYIPVFDLKWGEEIEYAVVSFDSSEKSVRMPVDGFQVVNDALSQHEKQQFDFQQEINAWMVEAVPNKPYGLYDNTSPTQALDSLVRRRRIINENLIKDDM